VQNRAASLSFFNICRPGLFFFAKQGMMSEKE
jgi:hypothetical protein